MQQRNCSDFSKDVNRFFAYSLTDISDAAAALFLALASILSRFFLNTGYLKLAPCSSSNSTYISL